MQEIIIDVRNVSKIYKKSNKIALQNISFQVEKGSIVGFLGPNGAGKSTMIKIILGVINPTEGYTRLLGKNSATLDKSIYRKIGVFMGGKTNLIPLLPVMDSLKYVAAIYRVTKAEFQKNVDKYGEILQCKEYLGQSVATLSLGQKIRAELMSILIYSPQVLILDEPTIGLDVDGKKTIHNILRELSQETGITILLTTHDLIGIDKLCSRIMLINNGEKVLDWNREEFNDYMECSTIIETDMELEQNIAEKVDMQRYLVSSKQLDNFRKILIKDKKTYTYVKYSQPTMEDLLYAYYRRMD